MNERPVPHLPQLEALQRWHAGQATVYDKLAPVTAMDHPELTTESFQRTAQWHREQAELLQKTLDFCTNKALHRHVYGPWRLEPYHYER